MSGFTEYSDAPIMQSLHNNTLKHFLLLEMDKAVTLLYCDYCFSCSNEMGAFYQGMSKHANNSLLYSCLNFFTFPRIFFSECEMQLRKPAYKLRMGHCSSISIT